MKKTTNPAPESLYHERAEQYVLAAILLEPRAIGEIALTPEMFFLERHQIIYAAMLRLARKDVALTLDTLSEQLKSERTLERVGLGYLAALIASAPTAAYIKDEAAIVERYFAKRALAHASTAIAELAYSNQDAAANVILERARARLESIAISDARPKTAQGLAVLEADVILATDWQEPRWAIPNLLPVGLSILAGAPKLGKSWLALQIAQAVAAGGVTLNERIERGRVLYLALEDPPRRLKERMLKQSWTRGLACDFLTLGDFEKQIHDLTNGGGERLARQIEAQGYRFVVIDTLSRAVSGDQSDVGEMTRGLAPLQEIAHAQNCAVMLIDHHRKNGMAAPDAIADILGSTAKGAMCDTAWGIYRERGKAGAKLSITGREVEEKTLALKMDKLTGVWQCDGDADVIALTARRQEILDALKNLGRAKLGELAKAIEQDKGNTYRRLQDLIDARLVNVKDDYYSLP